MPPGYLRGADVEPNFRLPIPKEPERLIWEVKPEPLPGKANPIGAQSEETVIEELKGHSEVEPLGNLSLADPRKLRRIELPASYANLTPLARSRSQATSCSLPA
jgi:hypothetical protein